MGQEAVVKKTLFPIKWVLLTILALVWGSSFILMKRGLTVFRPDQLAAIRMSVACFATLPLIWRKLKTIPTEKLKYISVVGIFGSGIPAFLFATAQTRINSSLAGMLNGLTPVFTMLVGSLFFHTKFTPRQIIGVFVGLIGACGLILLRSDGGLSSDFGYAILIVIATLCYGISVNTIKTFLSNIDSITISGAGLLFVGIPYSIYLFNTDFLSRFDAFPKAWEAFGFIATLSLLGTALSGVLYFQLVKISSPLFASVVTYFIPIVALIWGIADGEKLNPFHLLAMVAILGGVTLVSSKPKLKQ
jgi:drug/metabolite transporter (DMT)-like permease